MNRNCVENVICDCTPPHVPRFFEEGRRFLMSCAKRDYWRLLILFFKAAEAHERLFVSSGGNHSFCQSYLYLTQMGWPCFELILSLQEAAMTSGGRAVQGLDRCDLIQPLFWKYPIHFQKVSNYPIHIQKVSNMFSESIQCLFYF